MAVIIKLQPDKFQPQSFSSDADSARKTSADYDAATVVLLWAQEKREACKRSLTPKERSDLMGVLDKIKGGPKP